MKLKKAPLKGLLGNVIGYSCPAKKIEIVECQKWEADAIITTHHYSRKPTKNSFASLLVLWGGVVSGALQLGYGIRPKIKGNYNPDEVREFDRMWLSDAMPKYSETITLSLLHHYLKAAHPDVKILISYADTSAGNTGIIYKAANYTLEKKIKADFYILASGERVHPVSMYHRHKTRAWSFLQARYPGIQKADGYQLKFIFHL